MFTSRARFAIFVAFFAIAPSLRAAEPVTRVVFGSCAGQDRPQPFWNPINALHPDLFLMLGDNVYADTVDPSALRYVYNSLGAQPGFQRLKKTTPIMATWDDHDYGSNDTGANHPNKIAAQRVFLDFFGVPADSPRREQKGVYSSAIFGPAGKRLQVILLDTRYFRSDLRRDKRPQTYLKDANPAKTFLGAEQWEWLKARLREPADLRLLCSSIQVVADQHPYEKWGNLPLERERLLKEIKDSGARHLVILSGDRHLAEASVLRKGVGYDLWDFTSSSFNKPQGPSKRDPITKKPIDDKNSYRVSPVVYEANFGVIDIRWDAPSPSLTFEIHDSTGNLKYTQTVPFARLAPAAQ